MSSPASRILPDFRGIRPVMARIVGHLVRFAFRQLAAEVELHDPVGQGHDRLHQVFDHQDRRSGPADRPEDLDHAAHLGRVQAGQHFVEQQQTGSGVKGAGDLQSLLAGDGKVGGKGIGLVAQADEVENLGRLLASCRQG
jgi:hypothetical protein